MHFGYEFHEYSQAGSYYMCSELASQSVDETLGLTFTWHLEESANVRCPEPNHKNVSPLAFKKNKKKNNRTCYSSKLEFGPFKPDSQDIYKIHCMSFY